MRATTTDRPAHTLRTVPHSPTASLAPSLPAQAAMARASATPAVFRWLVQALDEVDYGMIIVDEEANVLHANRCAYAELDDVHPLQLVGQTLRARRSDDVPALHDALQSSAHRGLRRLLSVGEKAYRLSVAFVPLGTGGPDSGTATMVILGKRRICEPLSVQWFARMQGLTAAETRVLERLCTGRHPRQIGLEQGVGLSTIRTHIRAIRAKTGADGIRAVIEQIAKLPPMVGLVRSAAPAPTIPPWRTIESLQATS